MQDLNDLYYFAQVVEHRGFAAAGRALGIPKSKLSRRIARLEQQLGTRLLQRSSRGFAVTEIGQEFHRHCLAMLVEAESAQQAVARTLSGPSGSVRLSCPTALLAYQLADALARYQARCPDVQLWVDATNRRVDVIGESLDLAIRVRFPPLEDSELVLKVLGESTQCLVASPALVRGRELLTPADLPALPSLDEGPPQRKHAWQLHGADGATATVPHSPRLVTDDRLALRVAALHGIGVVQLPTMMVQEDLRAGRLVHVLPQWRPRPAIVHAVYPSRRSLLPAVRELLDFLAADCEAAAHLERDTAQAAPPPR